MIFHFNRSMCMGKLTVPSSSLFLHESDQTFIYNTDSSHSLPLLLIRKIIKESRHFRKILIPKFPQYNILAKINQKKQGEVHSNEIPYSKEEENLSSFPAFFAFYMYSKDLFYHYASRLDICLFDGFTFSKICVEIFMSCIDLQNPRQPFSLMCYFFFASSLNLG